MNKRCQRIVSREIRSARRKGKKRKQAIAIGLSIARKRGCKIKVRKK